MSSDLILQIVPRISELPDGVTDYAVNLARALQTDYDLTTIFATAQRSQILKTRGFEIVAVNDAQTLPVKSLILHYVNYGYQRRGLPLSLVTTLGRLRQRCSGRILVIFHELFASGPPWKSEFWLEPFQKKIAREIAQLADARLVSSESMRQMLEHIAPGVDAIVHPVPSAFGEPSIDLDQLRARNNHRWLICGGTNVVERSLRSFLQILNAIPKAVAPTELFVVGGTENPTITQMLKSLSAVRCEYHPAVSAEKTSQILRTCAFGWLDYFTDTRAKVDLILKSSSFANMCANAVVCVMPEASGPISIRDDALPGPFAIARDKVELPADRVDVAHAIYKWYHRHASIVSLAGVVGEALA